MLLVLEMQPNRGFDRKELWKFNRGHVNRALVVIKLECFSCEGTNEVEGCSKRNRINGKRCSNVPENTHSRGGIESMRKILNVDLLLLRIRRNSRI